MRLINKSELLSFAHEVVFSYYDPRAFGPQDLCIYTESLPNDFIYQPLIDSIEYGDSSQYFDLHSIGEQDSSFELEQDYYCCSRDRLFENDSKYYILSKKDLGNLINRLNETYDQMPDDPLIKLSC